MGTDHSLPYSQEPATYVYSRCSFRCSSRFSFILHVVCDRYFHVTEVVTSFFIAVLWYDRGMILFCGLKTCRVVTRYVLICFLFITDAA